MELMTCFWTFKKHLPEKYFQPCLCFSNHNPLIHPSSIYHHSPKCPVSLFPHKPVPAAFELQGRPWTSHQLISGPTYLHTSQFTSPNAYICTVGGQNPHGHMGQHANSTQKTQQDSYCNSCLLITHLIFTKNIFSKSPKLVKLVLINPTIVNPEVFGPSIPVLQCILHFYAIDI